MPMTQTNFDASNANGVANPPQDSPLQNLIDLLGPDVVLLPVTSGEKGPRWSGWPDTTIGDMSDDDYLSRFKPKSSIAVLTGAPSSGLCSIDIDDDDAVEPFLALNPNLRKTLRSRGNRGCNLWVQIEGSFPPVTKISNEDGRDWGEWRSDGGCTMIHGTHPTGRAYTRCPEVPPVHLSFAEIKWPEGLRLPWLATKDESNTEIVARFGEPVFYGTRSGGDRYVKSINEPYWAGLYDAEHTVLYEPEERVFFQYSNGTGLYSPISQDAIKQEVSRRMLEVSRQASELAGLENLRSDKHLSAVISQLKGIAEHRRAFAERPQAVHLSNCVLRFVGKQCHREDFSPEFRSRNQSPVSLKPEASCPRFLEELLLPAVHPEDAVLLQKMAGQCLFGHNLTQRFLILDGEPGRGKTQYSTVLQKLIGHENVTQLRTNHLGARFELFRFLRRTLLVGVDVDADFLSSKGAPVIKGLVGGDWFDAEQKGGTGSFPLKGNFNILMTSNSRLKVKLQGDVGAWRRRMLIVRYEAPPPKKKVPDFGEKLIVEEGPGILNWALNGLHMLLTDIEEGGEIQLSPRQAGVVDSLLAESDSLREFLRENVVKSEGSDLTVSEITRAYAHYCPEKGWSALPETQIGRELPDLMLELFRTVKAHSCQREGKAARGFRDVAFNDQALLP